MGAAIAIAMVLFTAGGTPARNRPDAGTVDLGAAPGSAVEPSMSSVDEERLLDAVWGPIAERWEERGFDRLTHAEQVFAAIRTLQTEINNGGFSQYLFNPSGDQAGMVVRALREVGASDVAVLCERFFALLPRGKPGATREERQDQLDAAADKLGEARFEGEARKLEQLFYGLDDDLRARMVRFARKQKLGESQAEPSPR